MGNVLEWLIDGTSGLAPGGVDGKCLVAGVCSKGDVGKGILLGKDSDLAALIGVGPLADRLNDIFATGGQNPIVIAVPVFGLSGSYVSTVEHTGTGAICLTSGSVAENAHVIIHVVVGGSLGVATAKVSLDGGNTFGSTDIVPANGQLSISNTGITVVFSDEALVNDDIYEFTIRAEIGPVTKIGTGPDIEVAGTVTAAGEIILKIISAGGRNVGTYQISLDGDNFSNVKTIPIDGIISVGDLGVTITFPTSDAVLGDTYSFELQPPIPTITSVMTALETPLSLYDVENIYVVGPSDSVDWAAMGAKADSLWNKHRPTYFICESRMPYDNETIDEWTAAMVAERQGYAHRFVSVCAAYGEVSDTSGKQINRNWAGLLQGRLLSIPVQRAIGRLKDAGISQGTLPEGYTEAHQSVLEENGYITAKVYAGLESAYWGEDKTLADVTSDYQNIRVLRTVFKAVRKGRIAALKSMYDEVGDPLEPDGAAGLEDLRQNIKVAIDTMKKAVPKELAGCVIVIPPDQDIVNNGVAVLMKLVGIPVIGEINIYASYAYAGSAFDPRLET